jgi:CBS domain containing-hemolysin-like protein
MNDDIDLPRTAYRAAGAASIKPQPEPLFERLLSLWKGSSDGLQAEEAEEVVSQHISAHERRLIANVEAFRDLHVDDVMVPRAKIVAVEVNTGLQALMEIVSAHPHSRLPVYRETLDEVVGVFHIKDLLAELVHPENFNLAAITRSVPIVAPSMRAVDLLLDMRRNRNHIALVVDEFGGIDGLVTIEDLIEEIVGEIEDEHDRESFAEVVEDPDGSLIVDARMPIETFEERFGPLVENDERDAFDTVGGLIWNLAGHIPVSGEVVHHSSGAEFEVIDADQRRIKRVRARRLAHAAVESDTTDA